MKIYDSFIMHDELDMLECRLYELQDSDVTHILVEATHDHWGRPKPLYYGDCRERFAAWNDRIIHVVAGLDDLDSGAAGSFSGIDPDSDQAKRWHRLAGQREKILSVEMEPDDILIYSDVDEILSPRAIRAAKISCGAGLRFPMRHFVFAVDWENLQYPQGYWSQAASLSWRRIGSIEQMRAQTMTTASQPMGWHLSWLGGNEGIKSKMRVYCHTELDEQLTDTMGTLYEEGNMPWGIGTKKLTPVNVDSSWPRYVYERKCPENWFRPR